MIKPKHHQNGAVLIISLIMLTIITLLGIYGMRTSTQESRMSGNFQDRALAMQSAEIGLRNAENNLENLTSRSDGLLAKTGAPPLIKLPNTITPGTDAWWKSKNAAWWTSKATKSTKKSSLATHFPHYIVEELGSDNIGGNQVLVGLAALNTYYYRITVRGTGKSDQTQVLLQTVYAKRF